MAKKVNPGRPQELSLKLMNARQEEAYQLYKENDVLFLLGTAGTGKSLLASYFALQELISKRRQKIIMTRPIVEAGESLGYLPGSFLEKVHPYMLPLYDAIQKLIPEKNQCELILKNQVEIAPLAYLRGRTFVNSVCILDEAQNATFDQITMFLSRFDKGSKIVITGDPQQSDIRKSPLMEIMEALRDVEGIGVVQFDKSHICRHPLVGHILDKLEAIKPKK